ncbi:MAG: hypothetical protein ABFD69_12495 [Candidatus Sumerlaeia bacterium]
MTKTALMLMVLIAGAVLPRAARAADAAAPAGGGSFEKFELIVQRNIFDPNRRAGRRAEDTSATTPVLDTIDLLGTIIEGGEAVAFTEGSNADNSRTLRLGETIADMKVAAISTEGLKMLAGDLTVEWPVGKRLTRQEGQAWTVADSPARPSSPRPSFRTGRSGNRTGRGSSVQQGNTSNTNTADTLARMRERRKREMGQ